MPLLRCDLCKVDLASEAAEKEHRTGRKHIQNEALHKQWADLARRSIYIDGFKKCDAITKQLFEEYFRGRFEANFKEVKYDSERGAFALVEFTGKLETQFGIKFKGIITVPFFEL